jgi:hypothetical protein
MDRGAALNCRVVYNWKSENPAAKNQTDKVSKKNNKKVSGTNLAEGIADEIPLQSSKEQRQGDEQNAVLDNSALKMMAEPIAESAPSKVSRPVGRRLGIFGFGAKSTTSSSGEKA